MDWACHVSLADLTEVAGFKSGGTLAGLQNAWRLEMHFSCLWLCFVFHLYLKLSWWIWIQIFRVTVKPYLFMCVDHILQFKGRTVNGFAHTAWNFSVFLFYYSPASVLQVCSYFSIMKDDGWCRKVSLEALLILCNALGVSYTWLMHDLSHVPATSRDKAAVLSKTPATVI